MRDESLQCHNESESFYEGLEIGAVSLKWVRGTRNGDANIKILQHGGNPRKSLKEIIDNDRTENHSPVVVTGQSAKTILNLPYRSESECIEKALAYHKLKPDILLSLGGETFSVYSLKDGLIKNINSTTKCAAGTGEFIVQQFERMGLTLEQGLEASLNGEIVQLATRCSVHCKSDATHKLNKGECNTSDIAKSLIYDLAKKVAKMIDLTKWPSGMVVISGGIARNKPFVKNLKQLLKNSEIKVLPESHYLESFGAYLFAAELPKTEANEQWLNESKIEFEVLEPLKKTENLLDYRVKTDTEKKIIDGESYILGVDAGSTTTKAVLFNVSDGSVGASCYLRTIGNPVMATKNCITELMNHVGGKSINIIQAGVTGSGREMVSVYLDNSESYNEILTHARAAAEDVPDVDTVFEIGGQDSKYISFVKGVPVDYAMNESCSAGTGSFLEESASVDMGIAVKDISGIAERSANPIAFGERCAAFINTDLRNALQQGASQEDIIAGLVYSIAYNYTSRVLGPRQIGENLLFLGGVALNKSVALAIAARTQSKVTVPSHPELMGCIGTALMIRDRLSGGDIYKKTYKLEDIVQGEMEIKSSFRCKACENNCEIQNMSIREKIYPFGGLCSKYALQRHKGDYGGNVKEGIDLVAYRNKMMFEEFGPRPVQNPRGTIGLPMALTAFELFPLYTKFINELGYDVILSEPSKTGNTKTLSSICYPCEIAHGAVYDLMNRDVDFIFLPRVLSMSIPGGYLSSWVCVNTNTIPDLIHAAFEKTNDKILSPLVTLTDDYINTTLKEFIEMGSKLGIEKPIARVAGENAIAHYKSFKDKYQQKSEKELEELTEQPTVVIAGRPYTTCSTEVNLSLPRKIISKGYNVISADILPQIGNKSDHPRNGWYFTQQIMNAIAYVKKIPNLYICLVSCFSCGPDAQMYHLIREELAGETFCYLEIDSHTAHAGFETRIGAFLDIIEGHHRRGKV